MLTIKLTESTNLAFDMIVEGSKSTVDQAWLVFESPAGYELRIPAQHSNNRVQCRIPAFEGILPNGPTTVHLEVVVDGRYYRPVTETVQLGKGQDISIITSSLSEEATVEAKKPSTFSQFGTPPKKRKSAHQKEVERRSKEYYNKQPVIEPNDQQVGNAKVTDKFAESAAVLDKLRNNTHLTADDQKAISAFGSKLDEQLAKAKVEHERKLADARKIAEAFVMGINTSSESSIDSLKSLIRPKK